MSRWKTGLLLLALLAFPTGGSAEGWIPTEILTAPGVPVSGVQIEASGIGELTAGYRVPDGGIQTVFARHRPLGGTWSVPVRISTPADVIDWDLDVGLDGTAAVVWTMFDGANVVTAARVRPPGVPPGAHLRFCLCPGTARSSPGFRSTTSVISSWCGALDPPRTGPLRRARVRRAAPGARRIVHAGRPTLRAPGGCLRRPRRAGVGRPALH